MVGRVFSHYKVIQHIGGGGMGVVYKAEDTRLKRSVALKFLPPELSRDPDTKARFIQEAQAASALQHNNVCTVHEIDETGDGQIFIVMDLYEGETLKQKIERGALPVTEATGIALQIAQGLAAAHERGILHRDIKPANILLTADGTVKILDFGLAKLSGRTLMTMAGTTLGTAAYMSPEGTRGEDADERGDIWSLGVVFYQMLSGRLPFGHEHEQAVIYNIQNTDPPPLGGSVPPECDRVARKALEKNPAERYQTVKKMLADLAALRGGLSSGNRGKIPAGKRPSRMRRFIPGGVGALLLIAAVTYFLFWRTPNATGVTEGEAPALRRLAVLPFSNLRSDPQTDFLGFALADQIIGHLAYVKTILVRPSMAVRQFQNQTVDAASAAKTLNVDFILTGNYLKEADIVRLSVELVDVHSNGIIWRESIEESYVNAFKLEDMVSEKVVSGLRIQFSPDEIKHMQADVPRNPGAYEMFLRGISNPTSIEGTQRSAAMLRQSIEMDSTYAPAFNELGYRLQQIANYAPGEQQQVHAAERSYQKALSLNPGLLSAIAGLSSLYTDIGKTEEAFELAQRALAVNPNSAESHFFLGYVFRYVGLMDDAVREMEKAVALDPGNPRFRSIGVTYAYRGEYEKALKGFDLDRESPFSLAWKAYVYVRMGDTARALIYCDKVAAIEGKSVFNLFSGVLRAYILGHIDEGRTLLRERDKISAIDGEQWFNVAEEEALLKDVARTARSLRNAIEGGFFNYPLMRTDSFLDPVRDDPAIRELIAEAKVKREAFIKRFKL
jgi:eukaryotic-like serine/threonine-protein kinase